MKISTLLTSVIVLSALLFSCGKGRETTIPSERLDNSLSVPCRLEHTKRMAAFTAIFLFMQWNERTYLWIT